MTPKSGGRPARDIAERCRSSLWAKQVWLATGDSFDAIDLWLIDDVRQPSSRQKKQRRIRGMQATRRVMNRIYRRGDSPERVAVGKRFIGNLVALAAKRHPRCTPAQADYENPIWSLLARGSEPAPSVLRAALADAVGRLGIACLSESELLLGQELAGSTFPVRPDDLPQIKDGADFVSTCGLDGILVLAIQCKLAASDAKFTQAQVYFDALETAAWNFGQAIDDIPMASLLSDLIEQRLIRNDWTPSKRSQWTRACLLDRRASEEERDEWSDRAVGASPLIRGARPEPKDRPVCIPLVRPDAKLRWFLDNIPGIWASMAREKIGDDPRFALGSPGNWKELLHQARHVFGEPRDVTPKLNLVVGWRNDNEPKIVDVSGKHRLRRAGAMADKKQA